MMKLTKRDYIHLGILTAFYAALLIVLTRFKYIYGSTIDWQEQHWAFPEYFRTLFYANHDIFPSLALNIGGGQNIYNFSYYGLFNPMVLLSYLFPHIRMLDYMVAVSILSVIAGTFLLYFWLRKNGYASDLCFLIGFLFLCAGPVIFQSHRQIMFVNYLPFLILGLIGVDYHFQKKSLLLVLSTFLMIMTSYFFSVGGILVLVLYGMYRHLKSETTLKGFFMTMVRLAIPIAIGVFLSGILILPTFFALLSGRSTDSGNEQDFLSLLLPKIKLSNLLYNFYSLGLTAVSVLAILSGFLSKKKEKILLSGALAAVTVFPVFIYLLNGTLYINAKVLIPFLPLVCLLTADFMEDLLARRISRRSLIILLSALPIIGLLAEKWSFKPVFFLDALLLIGAVLLFTKTGKKHFLYAPLIIFCGAVCVVVNLQDTLFLSSQDKIESSGDTKSLVESVSQSDSGFYRFSNEQYPLTNVNRIYSPNYHQTTLYSSIYNKGYNDFYFSIFNNEINFRNSVITNATKNVLFNVYMGNKYVITDQTPPIGYQFLEKRGTASVYKNDSVFPIGYATDKLMSESAFDKLEYPCTAEALLHYGIVGEGGRSEFTSDIQPYSLEIAGMEHKKLAMQENDGVYCIQADDNATMSVNLKEPIKGKVLFIRFHMDLQSKDKDTYIFINDVKNKLTCTSWKYQNNNQVFDYAISSNEPIEKLDIVFKKGKYQISSIETRTLDYDKIKAIHETMDCFEVNMEKTSGDFISGKISATKAGYFILNIPYEKGFSIKVNGDKVAYERVNKAFIGFPIEKGEKNIDIIYESPLQREGIALSVLGVILAITLCVIENKVRRKERS